MRKICCTAIILATVTMGAGSANTAKSPPLKPAAPEHREENFWARPEMKYMSGCGAGFEARYKTWLTDSTRHLRISNFDYRRDGPVCKITLTFEDPLDLTRPMQEMATEWTVDSAVEPAQR